ncbi:unnamed protein product [Prorocentrum cordatum]|nr:unnamed protein product [Polarella glacialis]|mmetsp:Transcript_69019/g.184858  ORF Transcript_69019/g.184858 Transcript_69019/m.184858 type:complete len:408 (+) Transcript_69019:126-1349(+)
MFGKLGTSEAPPRFDPVSLAVDSRAFSIVVYSMILLNCVFMVHAANEEIDRYSSGPSEFVVIVELIFQALYTIECIVKLWRFRLYYFYDSNWKYNWLDFSLLLMGVYYNFFENLLPNLTWLRMLRMLKLAKALRVIRLIAMVKPLRAILKSLASTIGTLGWSVVMLSGILFLFALIFVLRVASYLEEQELDGSLDPQVRDGLLQTYGSVETTMRNLYICSTGGDDWIACFDPLLPTGAVNQWVFLGFVAFTQIAVLNIILGIFVDEAMRSMLAETSERAREHAEELLQTERELRALCVEADTDGNGKLTQGEWLMAVKTSRLKNYLHMLDFRSSEVKDLVDSMCEQSPDGAVDIDAFVRACMRCRGAASRFDVQHVLRSIEGLRQSLRASGIDGRFTPPDASTDICR